MADHSRNNILFISWGQVKICDWNLMLYVSNDAFSCDLNHNTTFSFNQGLYLRWNTGEYSHTVHRSANINLACEMSISVPGLRVREANGVKVLLKEDTLPLVFGAYWRQLRRWESGNNIGNMCSDRRHVRGFVECLICVDWQVDSWPGHGSYRPPCGGLCLYVGNRGNQWVLIYHPQRDICGISSSASRMC